MLHLVSADGSLKVEKEASSFRKVYISKLESSSVNRWGMCLVRAGPSLICFVLGSVADLLTSVDELTVGFHSAEVSFSGR